ncbi:unnamed protein product [Closterium sp. NIES-53]
MAIITVVAVSRGGQQQPLPHPDTLSPQQLREWVIQRGRSGPGAWDYLRAGGIGQQWQSRCQETLSPQQLHEWVIQRGHPGGGGYVLGGTQQHWHQSQPETPSPQQPQKWFSQLRVSSSVGASESASALGASESAASADALNTFKLDSGASRCFYRDCTTVTPLAAPVPVSLADPSGGPVVARASTVLPCPAVPSGSLSGLHLSSFSTNLVSNAVLQDVLVDTFTPGGQRVAIYTCSWTARHLATLGHPSLPRLRGMHSRLLVSVLPRSLPPLPRSPAPPCLPRVEGRQRVAPHSSFPPTTAPLQTLHMDVWGPAPISGTDQDRDFLLVVDDYMRYTTVFPLRSKVDVSSVLIHWVHATCHQLREQFRWDLTVLLLHSDRGGKFSSGLLAEFYRDEGIRQTFTLPASPQKNGISQRRICLIMDAARTSMIHAAAPHFLWPFVVRYAAHQLNLWPVSLFQRPRPHSVGRERSAMRRHFGSGARSPCEASRMSDQHGHPCE